MIPHSCLIINDMIGSGVAAKSLHGLKVCTLPRPENNYQPLALHHRSLTFISTLLVTIKVLTLGLVALTPATAELSTITSARIVQLTNDKRVAAGLQPLTVNDTLSKAAAQKAQDMLEHDYFAHISPGGITPWFWMQKAGYTYQMAGENLAIDFVEAEDVVAAWMASPSHKENIVQPNYIETGVAALTGEYQGGTSTVVVHMFGRPLTASSPSLETEEASASEIVASPTPTLAPTSTPKPLSPKPSIRTPRTPRIAVIGTSTTVDSDVTLSIDGDPGSTVFVLVNNILTETIGLPEQGSITRALSLIDVPDGAVEITAYARNVAGITSETISPVSLTKDTQGPELARSAVSFLVGPAIDQPEVALLRPSATYDELVIQYDMTEERFLATDSRWLAVFPLTSTELIVTPFDAAGNAGTPQRLSLTPSFFTERETEFVQPPAHVSKFARQLSFVVALIIALLLFLAIIIRVRIQYPRMIAHASFVVLLAGVLLLF